MIVATPEVPGIEKVSGSEVEYLLLVKTRPGSQYPVSRELRRRIKMAFEKNHIEPGNPNRWYVVDAPKPRLTYFGWLPNPAHFSSSASVAA